MATYTVSSWSDFLLYNTTDRETSDVIYFADSNITDGTFTGQGTGTRNDPYICGTYNEMMVATGARYLYNLQLVEEDSEEDMKLYYCNGKFARHDRTNTTIDANFEGYSSGINTITIRCNVNFNGWTLQNFKFYPNANIVVSASCQFRRAICLNWEMSTNQTGLVPFTLASNTTFSDNIIQLDVVGNTATQGSVIILCQAEGGNSSYSISIYRCTFTIYVRAAAFAYGYNGNSSAYYTTYYDCTFNNDISVNALSHNSNGSQSSDRKYVRARFYNCQHKGSIIINNGNTSSSYTNTLCYVLLTTIFDCNVTHGSSDNTLVVYSTNGVVASVFNSEKATIANAIPVTSTELLQPATLRQKGFPMGGG